MNGRLKHVGDNILFCFNIFIVFLMFFDDRLLLPAWVQAIGRLHPLVLHFPIVLLLLALGMHFLRNHKRCKSEPFYHTITDNLLFAGVLAAGITAVMGIFLSSEGGYDNDLLAWHKWSGVLIVILGSLVYWLRNYSWYKPAISKIFIVTTAACIIVAGHYGAGLTHGENFVLAPLTEEEQNNVAFNDAIVFDHLIEPLFEAKCQSCHNKQKDKGKLILMDSLSIAKGGKTGKLFVAGNPEISLLLERLHLPEDNKKHMPPRGKIQLSSSEMDLLYWWIKSGAPYNKKLAELAPEDSLRLIASEFISNGKEAENVFAFAPADPALIQSLNNKNRTVYSVSMESPALAVTLYNKIAYSPKLIDELKPVKEQVVSLEADRLPVTDDDLKRINMFNNLRKLSLNFTKITSKGLTELKNLKDLSSISLSGTNLEYEAIRSLMPSFTNLKRIFVWNAGLDSNQVKNLQKSYPAIEWQAGFIDDGTRPLPLNKVLLQNSTQVFRKNVAVILKHPIKGVDIRYTTDGSEPDSINSKLFKDSIELTENTTVKARAFKSGWFKSDIAVFNFFRSSFKPDTVILSGPLHERFPALGSETFFDGQLGGEIHYGDKWAGISGKPMEIVMRFNNPISIESVSFELLLNAGFASFPPETVEVWGGSSDKELHLLSKGKPVPTGKNAKSSIERIAYSFPKRQVNYLKLVVKPPKWPAWHANKGQNALLFIDEIFLN